MNEYDFSRLNDKEFEVLCVDLLGARETLLFERFKPGRDGGVDGRFFKSAEEEFILQCKHWPSSPIERLVKNLEDKEFPKVLQLKPARYFLALSHSLSRTDKQHLMKSFAPYIKSTADILGREDLNDLLSKHPKVEERHYKLWISSATVLNYRLNKAIKDRSSFALEEIVEAARVYVATSNHQLAIEKLKALGTVIVTGPAGIGKTTLAEQLILHHVTNGFELISIGDEIREAEKVFEHDNQQLFYFDDFLGRNYLEALSGHEGSQIVQFIKRVQKDRRKRFILTSRTTILNQGKVLNDVFENNNIDRNEFEITLESLSQMDKARILYNHIWHSQLNPEYIEELYQKRRYRRIIDHANFNPRLIRFITDAQRLEGINSTDYWDYVCELLNNPTKVWAHPFEAQTDDFGRALILLVALNGDNILEGELAEAFSRFIGEPINGQMQGKRDYFLNLRHLSGSMLNRVVEAQRKVHLKLFNPSLGDFVIHRYASDLPSLRAAFNSLRTTSSLRALRNMADTSLITHAAAEDVAHHIFVRAADLDFVGVTGEYVALLCNILLKTGRLFRYEEETSMAAVNFVLNSPCPVSFIETAKFLLTSGKKDCADPGRIDEFVISACKNYPTDYELTVLGEITGWLKERDSVLACEDVFVQSVTEHLSDDMDSEFPDGDVFDDVTYGDSSHARGNLETLIRKRLLDFGLIPTTDVVDYLLDSYDMPSGMERYFEDDDSSSERETVRSDNYGDEIDDLFSRES